jgi:hypothetical protein
MTMKSPFLGWIKKHDLWVFFILVFALMWQKGIAGSAYSLGLISEPPPATSASMSAGNGCSYRWQFIL